MAKKQKDISYHCYTKYGAPERDVLWGLHKGLFLLKIVNTKTMSEHVANINKLEEIFARIWDDKLNNVPF